MPSTAAAPAEKNVQHNLERIKSSAFGARPAVFKNTLQEILFIFATTMAIGLDSFLSGAVAVISTYIGRDLNMTTVEITWIAAASGLSAGAFLLFFGRLSDLFGNKQIFIASIFLFCILCVGAGFSNNGITMDVLNGLLGLTAASGVPPALGMLGSCYDEASPRKNAAFAVFSAGNPLGFVFGCLIAGVATEVADWRATFWVLAVLYAFVAAISLYAIPPDRSEKEPFNFSTLKKFDLGGVLLSIAGIALFSAALGMGSEAPNGWKTPYILVLLILGVVLLVAFVFWELKFEYPLLPMTLWKDRNFTLLITIFTLGCLAFPIGIFWTAIYYQTIEGYSPLQVALRLLPSAVSGIALNVFAGYALHRISNKLLMTVGSIGYLISFVLYGANRHGITWWALLFPGAVITVTGADLQFNVCNMYVMSSMPPSQQAVAGALLQTISKIALTVGFGVATAIFSVVEANPPMSGYYGENSYAPFAAVFWMCAGVSALSIGFLPFLTIKTQGGKQTHDEVVNSVAPPAGMGVQASEGIFPLARSLSRQG